MKIVTSPADVGVCKENADPNSTLVRVSVKEDVHADNHWSPVLVLDAKTAQALARELYLGTGRTDAPPLIGVLIVFGVIASTEIPSTWWGWICKSLSWFIALAYITGSGRR